MSELNKLILKAVTSSSLQDRGTFYFLFSHVDAGRRSRYTITFVDADGKMSASPSFGLVVNDWLKNAIAIDMDTVLIVPHDGAPFTLVTTNKWKSITIPSADPKEVLRSVIDGLLEHNPASQTTLTRVRETNQGHDFVIACEDGDIPVHSIILKASWPFFDRLLDSKMQEATDKRLTLPYPKEWIEPLVSHFYGEQRNMSFEEATGVIITAAVYDLPALHSLALRRIREETMDVLMAVVAWKRAYEAMNQALMEYCGAVIQTEMKNFPKVQHLLQDFSQDEFLQLFSHMSLHAQKATSKTPCPSGYNHWYY
ncbi:hypothetical protein B0I72DRAFT_139623 [Yarrowia lipolytica]|jgi:hypothetical protein|uniref:YALI0A06347p n=2 Tax=Yarrowia lipolytica TaxID=4952 RepID=Q6CHQ7_YARLI|nr:YALI0A06347p [Yarrowia lipolytica CLIB122]AOW00307.1 hypothetical protein YALI1_A06052g [Yarrowia lipolytica]KAB8284142.1 hypothetical protein BKA91DRAFT_135365 [Yarrowia lipolytica]KAE8173055.1 hypothetical protein BKA90DRAFT_136163 [Yarrowia lipolytica]KAJ8051410.1 hypothetical protein LXG23DRAFT_50997 [Yarrowia lipolytica]QNP95097.1 Hypothetical protein YALI2_A00096g [Yarrowia lipolytica]|eukprot:XP_499804.1 YALI0A06347p [Yarrowia lipolytica CLIB122]